MNAFLEYIKQAKPIVTNGTIQFYKHLRKQKDVQRAWAVEGTKHKCIAYAPCEGDVRRMFHEKYNGESIRFVSCGGYAFDESKLFEVNG